MQNLPLTNSISAPAAGAVRPGKRVSEHPVPGGRRILGDQLRTALMEENRGADRKWPGGDLDCQGPQPPGAGIPPGGLLHRDLLPSEGGAVHRGE